MSAARAVRLTISARSEILCRVLLASILYLIAASSTTNTFVQRWGLGVRIEQMLNNDAPRPFAYRVLSPAVIRFVAERLPPGVVSRLLDAENAAGLSPVERWRSHYRTDRPGFGKEVSRSDQVAFLVCYAYIFLVLFLFAIAMRFLIGNCVRGSPLLLDIAPSLMLLVLPLAYTKGGYIYDFPELLFAALATLSFLRRWWVAYYVIFALAIINKESAVLFAAWVPARFLLDRDREALLKHLALHAMVAIPCIVSIHTAFAHKPSVGIFEPMSHLAHLSSPESWLSFHGMYLPSFPMVPGPLNVAVLAAVIWLTASRHAREDRELFLLYIASLLVIGALFLTSGFEDEIRVFGLIFPVMFTLATRSILARSEEPAMATQRIKGDSR